MCKKSFLLFSQRRILSLLLLVALYSPGTLSRVDLLQCLKTTAFSLEFVQINFIGDSNMVSRTLQRIHSFDVLRVFVGVRFEGVDLLIEEIWDRFHIQVLTWEHERRIALHSDAHHVHIHAIHTHRKASIEITLIIITHQ